MFSNGLSVRFCFSVRFAPSFSSKFALPSSEISAETLPLTIDKAGWNSSELVHLHVVLYESEELGP